MTLANNVRDVEKNLLSILLILYRSMSITMMSFEPSGEPISAEALA